MLSDRRSKFTGDSHVGNLFTIFSAIIIKVIKDIVGIQISLNSSRIATENNLFASHIHHIQAICVHDGTTLIHFINSILNRKILVQLIFKIFTLNISIAKFLKKIILNFYIFRTVFSRFKNMNSPFIISLNLVHRLQVRTGELQFGKGIATGGLFIQIVTLFNNKFLF